MPKLLPVLGLYVFGVWMAIVYLGEHYVFDAVIGVVYALAAYLVVIYGPAWVKFLAGRRAAAAQVPQSIV